MWRYTNSIIIIIFYFYFYYFVAQKERQAGATTNPGDNQLRKCRVTKSN